MSASKVHIARRNVEADFLIRQPSAADCCRATLEEQRARWPAKRLERRLHANRRPHTANAQQVGVEAFRHRVVRTERTVGQLCLGQLHLSDPAAGERGETRYLLTTDNLEEAILARRPLATRNSQLGWRRAVGRPRSGLFCQWLSGELRRL